MCNLAVGKRERRKGVLCKDRHIRASMSATVLSPQASLHLLKLVPMWPSTLFKAASHGVSKAVMGPQ